MTKNRNVKLGCLSLAIGGILSAQAMAAETENSRTATNPNLRFQPAGVSQSDFGGTGLLQMPTARMAETGEFSLNYRDNDEYRRYSVSLQLFDWLETTVRYTDIRTRLYSGDASFSGNQTYKDKAFDLKARLWQESYWMPDVSLGLRDIAGTGLFDSEYLVASKRMGPFDFTLGMGWGNMAESGNIKNPACSLKASFCNRTQNTEIGQFEVKNFLHGPAALFGGIEYQTPWDPLRLKLEYDGNDYSREFAGAIKQDSPFNIGAVYRVGDILDTTLSWQRGNTLMWGFTLRTSFNSLKPNYLDDAPPVYAPVQDGKGTNWQLVSKELNDKAGFKDADIYADQKQVTIVADQTKYRDSDQATQRAATVLANHVPGSIDEYHIVQRSQRLPIASTEVDAKAFHQVQQAAIPLGQPEPATHRKEPVSDVRGQQVLLAEPDRLTYSLDPTLVQSFGGPESFYMYQIALKGNVDYRLSDHWSVGGTALLNLVNNYDKFNYKSPPADGAALPRVRTWVREYSTSSDLLLTNLQLTRRDNPAQDWYTQVYGGYLEMMYAGVGSEVLYRPFGKSWALGLDVNYVKQRDWNDIMRMADYDVVTGHLTAYWELPFVEGAVAKVSVGRYLAGDKGVTLDLSRRFDSGIVAGAFATKTNVSAAEYGEGSFTKGFYVSIPFDLLFTEPTVKRGAVGWVPLTRDGGQMLQRRSSLYGLTDH
ncbi:MULTISPECIES: YjbH domain-containing protein [Pectobacterium]|uniref:YjbH domain-containing protein n=1 Tax=Pectobacterium TaxID=122277 RepID=UPI00049A90D9|nr:MULTISPECIES: YjbH domain-containing protein [Pectobacterium]GKV86622.1 membrane protein [Pectobacterium carotovorum subsp. carotovorum]AIA70401.1 membrane protein [Pectobacterium atrosepticum]AIK13321.1 extracellular polysaccharide biosynthesis protein [Pectobacterium atrosepticum]ATY90224.1 YjbH domain-containing protein [Pectobacterium atrosepticum]KFX17144.1 membrane protein [Pectobacterium atrosepticum]